MEEAEIFLVNLLNEFRGLEALLHRILKEEKRTEEDILDKKGFIIKRYFLNYSKIDLSQLDKILFELERIKNLEVGMQEQLIKHLGSIKQIEKGYKELRKKKLHSDLLQRELKDILYYSNLMITRVRQLRGMLKEGLKLHKKSLGKDTEIFFASFEHISNKILRFIHFLEQLTNKILAFEKEAYYPKPRMYGRAMASAEFKRTIKSKCLSSWKDPIPVFDAPVFVRNRIRVMSKDNLKTFFTQVGVKGGVHVVFFQTKVKPYNYDRPIPQSNGLREYKFPKDMNIEILEAA